MSTREPEPFNLPARVEAGCTYWFDDQTPGVLYRYGPPRPGCSSMTFGRSAVIVGPVYDRMAIGDARIALHPDEGFL